MVRNIAVLAGIVGVAVLGRWMRLNKRSRSSALPASSSGVGPVRIDTPRSRSTALDDDTAAELILRAGPALVRARQTY